MPKDTPSQKRTTERLTRNERFLFGAGMGLAFFLTLGLGLLMVALRVSGASSDPDAQTPVIAPDYPRRLIDFSLIDQSGRALTRKDLDGKIVVVNFVFTSCATVCPYVNAQMAKIQQLTAGQADVRLLSLALDPVDDTAPVLAKYGQTYGEDDSRWSFLTGYQSEMRRLVGVSFLPPDTTGEFAYMPGNFAHSQRIALVDRQGHLVEYFDGLNQEAADSVVAEIAKLRKPL
jgi:protein SCO1/2